jgi:hypothetical protein
LFKSAASPVARARIYEAIFGCKATPADAATDFRLVRTTAVGTEGSGYVPTNIDSGGGTSECDFGVGVFSVEPTKTANADLLRFSLNQRATFRWVAAPGSELVLPATQNNGACAESVSSTVTTAHEATMYFEE